MKKSLTILSILLSLSHQANAQYHETVFPDLEGTSLSKAIISKYKTNRVLSYREAREKMYREIDRKNGKLTCIYTGFSISVSSSVSTGTVLNKGINCEHSYPQSKGATGNAKSDMHHLFPTRIDVNSARGSLPFGEINDNYTDKWFKGSTNTSKKPSTDIDSYSELDENKEFEPREDIKGDIARAAFYFRTIYSSADKNFFSNQVDDLCDWHLEDPVDQTEWDRNNKIAQYQGKKNPFVLDCSLARLYCKNVTVACLDSKVNVIDEDDKATITPNPFQDLLSISNIDNASILKVFNSNGVLVHADRLQGEKQVDLSMLSKGIYVVSIYNNDNQKVHTEKFIKL